MHTGCVGFLNNLSDITCLWLCSQLKMLETNKELSAEHTFSTRPSWWPLMRRGVAYWIAQENNVSRKQTLQNRKVTPFSFPFHSHSETLGDTKFSNCVTIHWKAVEQYITVVLFVNPLTPRVKPWVIQSFLTFDFMYRTLKCDHSLESC